MSEEIERFQPREVDYYRSRNLPSFATWLVPTLPAGVAFGALSLHSIPLLVLGLVLAVAGAVWIFRRYPMVAPQFVEFRDDDYSFWYKYSWIAPLIPIGPLYGLIEPTLPHLELEPPLLLVSAGAGLYATLGLAWGAHLQVRWLQRIGARRVRRLSHSLEGVTPELLELVDRQHVLLAGLQGIGAVDGGAISATALSRVTGTPLSDAAPSLRELDSAGLVHVNRIGLYADEPKWRVTLTPLGVRCVAASARR